MPKSRSVPTFAIFNLIRGKCFILLDGFLACVFYFSSIMQLIQVKCQCDTDRI